MCHLCLPVARDGYHGLYLELKTPIGTVSTAQRQWLQALAGQGYRAEVCKGWQAANKQYLTGTGPLDILAVSKDKQSLLVVELKKGRASDVVVGQSLRYRRYVQEELAENNQTVRGVIIALEDDQRIRRALSMTPSIDFYRYQISFKLVKA